MNSKTAKLIRKFATEMGITDKSKVRAMRKKHNAAPWPEKARSTDLMRKTLVA